MDISIRDINFDEHTVTVQIDSSDTAALSRYLSAFIEVCGSLDYNNVVIHDPDRLQSISKLLKANEVNEAGVNLEIKPCTFKEHTSFGSSYFTFQFRNLHTHNKSFNFPYFIYEYQLNMHDLNNVISNINDFTILTGQSLLLDDITLNNLRLCAYELCMNSLEHGSFSDQPSISLCYSVSESSVKITYIDNGAPFVTSRSAPVDIGTNIDKHNKRGLGLFILNRLSEDIRYKRYNKWNVTRFTIKRYEERSMISLRRTNMATFTTQIKPGITDNSIVLKPLGTMDSSAAEPLEAQINSLIEQNKTCIVLDFSELEFISSAGIGLLLGTVATLREKNGDLIFMNVPKNIKNIFDIINVTSYFRHISSLEELKEPNKV